MAASRNAFLLKEILIVGQDFKLMLVTRLARPIKEGKGHIVFFKWTYH